MQNYNIQLGTSAATLTTVATGVTGTSYTFASLAPSTNYVVGVIPVCPFGTGISYTVDVPTLSLSSVCSALDAPVITDITAGATSVVFSWQKVNGATSYSVEYHLRNDPSWFNVVSATPNLSSTITNLFSGNSYEFRVRANCSANNTTTSPWRTISSFTSFCQEPLSLSVSNITTSAATLSWGAASGSLSYQVEYKPISSTSWITFVNNTTATSATITNLSTETTYDWRVRTNCLGSSSIYTAAQFTTAPSCYNAYEPNPSSAPAPIPLNIPITAAIEPGAGQPFGFDADYYQFTTAGSGNITVKVSNAPANMNLAIYLNNVGIAETTAIQSNTDLVVTAANQPAGTYTLRVLPVTATSTRCYTFTVTGNSIPPCLAPTGLTSSVISKIAVVSWAAVNGATSYTVEYKTSTASTWTTVSASTTATSVSLPGLSASTTYDWRVRTNCLGGNSANTQSQFTTPAPPPCGIPTGLSSSAISNTSVTLSWLAATEVLNYTVEYKTVGVSTWSVAATNTTATSVNITGLSASTTYDWRIRTNCLGGSSANVQSQFITTCGTGPISTTTANITPSSALLSWSPLAGINTYFIEYKLEGTLDWISAGPAIAGSSFSLNNLQGGSIYRWRIYSTLPFWR